MQPLADNTILHLSELETAGVRLLGHQITSPLEQRRVVLLVLNNFQTSPFYPVGAVVMHDAGDPL